MGLKTGQKKGINIYYDYRKTVFELLTDKQLRNVIYCLLDLDEHGEITENKKSYEEIQKDNTAKIVFDILKTNNERASAAWHRINKAKHPELYQDETENEYLPSETIKNDLRGISDNERGITENGEEDAFEFFGNLIEQEKNEKITDDNIDDLEKLNGF